MEVSDEELTLGCGDVSGSQRRGSDSSTVDFRNLTKSSAVRDDGLKTIYQSKECSEMQMVDAVSEETSIVRC